MQVITLGSSPGSGVGALAAAMWLAVWVLAAICAVSYPRRLRLKVMGVCVVFAAVGGFAIFAMRLWNFIVMNGWCLRTCGNVIVAQTTLLVAFLAVPIVVPLAQIRRRPVWASIFSGFIVLGWSLFALAVWSHHQLSVPTRGLKFSISGHIIGVVEADQGETRRVLISRRDGYDEVNIERDGTIREGHGRDAMSESGLCQIDWTDLSETGGASLSVADSTVVAQQVSAQSLFVDGRGGARILVGVRSIFVFDYRASSRTGLFEANAVARCGDLIFVSYGGSVVMYDAVSRVVVEMCGVTRESHGRARLE